jgi:hypothetical protein
VEWAQHRVDYHIGIDAVGIVEPLGQALVVDVAVRPVVVEFGGLSRSVDVYGLIRHRVIWDKFDKKLGP